MTWSLDLQSKIGNRQSAIGNRQSTIGNRQSAIGNRQSAIGNRQSAIGNRQSPPRDLDVLRDEEHAPLQYDAARHGYRLTDETFALAPVRISRREAFSFALARKLLAHYEATPLHLDMRSVLDKIAESLEGDITLEPSCLAEHVDVLPEDHVRVDPELWAQMARCVEQRHSLRAKYQTFDGRVSEYQLEPCHLLAYHGNWYVFARNVSKDRIETFALSRFGKLELTGRSFLGLAGFDPKEYARRAFGITGGEKPIKVRLLFEAKVVVYIAERQWHPTQRFRHRRDGRLEMTLETTGRKELIRWILSWMPEVRVLSPKSLRDRVRQKLEAGLARQKLGLAEPQLVPID